MYPPILYPTKKTTTDMRTNWPWVIVIISLVYYKYVKGLRYPLRGATGMRSSVPQTLDLYSPLPEIRTASEA